MESQDQWKVLNPELESALAKVICDLPICGACILFFLHMNIDTSSALKFQNACDPMPNRYKSRLFRVTTHWTKQTSIPLLFSMKSFRTKDLSLEYRIILGH